MSIPEQYAGIPLHGLSHFHKWMPMMHLQFLLIIILFNLVFKDKRWPEDNWGGWLHGCRCSTCRKSKWRICGETDCILASYFLQLNQWSSLQLNNIFFFFADMLWEGGGPVSQPNAANDQSRQFLLLRNILWLFTSQLWPGGGLEACLAPLVSSVTLSYKFEYTQQSEHKSRVTASLIH